jgi:hypothetical protein
VGWECHGYLLNLMGTWVELVNGSGVKDSVYCVQWTVGRFPLIVQ